VIVQIPVDVRAMLVIQLALMLVGALEPLNFQRPKSCTQPPCDVVIRYF
jgi:hypothetical protein